MSKSAYKCTDHRYKTRIISRTPLIIYIDKFLLDYEIQHLIELAETGHQTSSTVDLECHKTPVVKCIAQRFARFQANIRVEHIEPLRVVKYTSDQKYEPYVDWFLETDLEKYGSQRVATFFTYLYANCSHGETEFVNVRFNKFLHGKFCDILVCNEDSRELGIQFRPIAGNTIFWYNVDEQGQGDVLTARAEQPPQKGGFKIGLNTWTHVEKVFVKE
ncbi:unnamed protein product [Adineta ricciae]|uniref:Prolyl 4-hydroxylase alpha subunit domain-containing protein n=1 Tax=Adineta ricciae TaxID=249248 RepID=A0A814ZY46_ADIRI|nr:unnamed protein product [Adineta ricciae]CAF1251667.1 unnamed protein product [Adineta ricciae]